MALLGVVCTTASSRLSLSLHIIQSGFFSGTVSQQNEQNE
jgi:hypothetical protein